MQDQQHEASDQEEVLQTKTVSSQEVRESMEAWIPPFQAVEQAAEEEEEQGGDEADIKSNNPHLTDTQRG